MQNNTLTFENVCVGHSLAGGIVEALPLHSTSWYSVGSLWKAAESGDCEQLSTVCGRWVKELDFWAIDHFRMQEDGIKGLDYIFLLG